MSDIVKFQTELMQNEDARKRFAADPKAYLAAAGIKVPAGVKLPDKLPLAQLESNVEEVSKKLAADKLTISKVGASSAGEFAKFVGEVVPIKTGDIAGAVGARSALGSPGDVATAAVVAVGVVVAVVAVAVVAAGNSSELQQFARPELGITGVTAGRIGLTLHGPNGLRAEGLTAEDVAQVIRNLR